MEHLSSFEAAAKSQGIDPTKLPEVSLLPEALGKATVAAYKLFVISQAAWQGVKIDWNNYSQYKYYPWFDLETYAEKVGSGAGFSYYGGFSYDRTSSIVGSRLCFPDSKTAKYVGETHFQLYRDLMVIE